MDEKESIKNQKQISQDNNIIYVFVDASNLWQAQKAKGKFLNWENTIKYIKAKYNGSEIRFFYYDAYPAEGTRSYNLDKKHRFYTYLQKGLNFIVIKKQLKRISVITEQGESVEEKGNMDVEMTIGAVHNIKKYQTAVFFTGDSDFLALITYLKNHGKKIYIFSSRNNISMELRTGGNGYTDILSVEEIWGKELKHRAELEKQ